jgi:UPF0716 protein FxsA
MWGFALILAVPLIEIALFVTIGAWFGLWLTLAIVLGTAVLGVTLVRWQGLGVLRDIQTKGVGDDPFSPLAHGALILLGGFLLILPGFFTDTLGLLLMIPALRRGLIGWVGPKIRFEARGFARSGGGRDDWVDAEYEEVVPDRDKIGGAPDSGVSNSAPSKWTRH